MRQRQFIALFGRVAALRDAPLSACVRVLDAGPSRRRGPHERCGKAIHMIGRMDPKALRQTLKGDAVA